MSRYERRMFFEALVQLRQKYAGRGMDDASSCISVDDAVANANRLLTAVLRLPPGSTADTESVQADAETR